MGFSRQEYWSGLPSPPPRALPNPGTEPRSPTLQADSLPSEPPGKPKNTSGYPIPLPGDLPDPGNHTGVSCIAGRFLISWGSREAPSFLLLLLSHFSRVRLATIKLKTKIYALNNTLRQWSTVYILPISWLKNGISSFITNEDKYLFALATAISFQKCLFIPLFIFCWLSDSLYIVM